MSGVYKSLCLYDVQSLASDESCVSLNMTVQEALKLEHRVCVQIKSDQIFF